ncbi:MAG: hypothetical protein IID40_05305 [Planctomycetes bacterium]|nr:hypothetical protein [Planctomycetota bacterium]
MSLVRRSILMTALTVGLAAAGCEKQERPAAAAKSTSSAAAQPAQPAAASAPLVTGREELPPGHPPMGQASLSAPRPAPGAAVAGDPLTTAGLRFAVPDGWISQPPSSAMRVAQFELPGDGPDAGAAQMAVFAGIGGSVQANIDRWVGQFRDPAKADQKPATETFQKGGLKVTIVRAGGTHTAATMNPNEPHAAPMAGSALFGIIVEGGPGGNVFLKTVGPAATVEVHLDALHAFAQSVTVAE